MDKTEAKAIMKEAEAAIAQVFADHGLRSAGIRASYDAGSIKITLTGEGVGADSPKVRDWERWAESYGLPKDALGKTIIVGRKAFKITGLIPTRRKFPVAVEELITGKPMLLTLEGVKRGLGFTGPESGF